MIIPCSGTAGASKYNAVISHEKNILRFAQLAIAMGIWRLARPSVRSREAKTNTFRCGTHATVQKPVACVDNQFTFVSGF